ncbi:class I SAM-dependent methyltransferase [Candidatus Pacearchaeota archaeon]|nr:class I SAM-dependent methyltransferase [Candidatus Pacearchaeota archaeon]
MNYKQETLKSYNQFADYFDEKFEDYKNVFIKNKLEQINLLFPNKSKILDLGAGPGNQAVFFKNKGHEVLCLDICEKFLEKCKEKNLSTIKMDFENLSLPEKSFDVVWAYTSLLHVPKSKVPAIIRKIKGLLRKEGFFLISLKEGKGEGFLEFRSGTRRWFSLYTEKEMKGLLKKDFKVIKSWRVRTENNKVFIDYLCKKK